jgi:hypothetical protein
LHRAGVAAYLAAYGLAGRGVEAAGYPEDGPSPTALAFETGDAVDDLRCDMSDRTVLRLQAKRKCGNDNHLASTVAQWAGQLSALGVGDRVGLATAEPQGPVRYLAAALERRSRAIPGPFTTDEQDGLAAVMGKLPAEMPAKAKDRLLDAAVVMYIAAGSPRDAGFGAAANLLDGTVVPARSGTKAVRALRDAFHEQAASGAGSCLDDWLQVLADAGLQVYADAAGPAGPRRRAELDAVAGYRTRLAARAGILTYSLLADDLPPMKYPPLAGSFQVSVPGKDKTDQMLDTARRWRRMLLTGLPGMGKSAGLEQAAARWAADPAAPVPVLVQLRRIAACHPRTAADITLASLIDAATAEAPEPQRAALRRFLEHATASGEAILLLDGLDECRDRRGVIADGLAAVAQSVPTGTGIILATRSSAVQAARKAGLPEAQLIEPYRLDGVLKRLLDHAAACRGVVPAERQRWVEERWHQLDELFFRHRDLARVPLLASLLTLLVARPDLAELPASRAQLLTQALQDTVRRWELAGLSESPSSSPLSAGLLLDVFSEIAHAISADTVPLAATVREQVAAMLGSRWGKPPGQAAEQAVEAMMFWDEHVGVFVETPVSGILEARSRVFADIGDSLWALRQESAVQRAWIHTAVADDDRRESAVLAASMSTGIAAELAAAPAAGEGGQLRTMLWAADAVHEGAALNETALDNVLSGLACAAVGASGDQGQTEPAQDPRFGSAMLSVRPGWACTLRIATLPLPTVIRARRDSILAELTGTSEESAIAAALAALADARTDHRAVLSPAEAAVVENLLARLPPPALAGQPGELPADDANLDNVPDLLPGHHEAAEQAIAHLAQLAPSAAAGIYRVARCGTAGGYDRVRDRLAALGHEDQEWPDKSPGLMIDLSRLDEVPTKWATLFEAAAEVAAPGPLAPSDQWSLPDLARLFDILQVGQAKLVSIDYALTTDKHLLPGWIRSAARAAGTDLPALAAQAASALRQWPGESRDIMAVMFAPPPSPAPKPDITLLDQDDHAALLAALSAESDWVANIACSLLATMHDPAIGQLIMKHLPSMPATGRLRAALVAIANDPYPESATQDILNGADPAARSGAAAAALNIAGPHPSGSWPAILQRARADDDMTVRLAAGQDDAAAASARYWSCLACSNLNEVEAARCVSCRRTRPAAASHPSWTSRIGLMIGPLHSV